MGSLTRSVPKTAHARAIHGYLCGADGLESNETTLQTHGQSGLCNAVVAGSSPARLTKLFPFNSLVIFG
jgi:hypothetical protein